MQNALLLCLASLLAGCTNFDPRSSIPYEETHYHFQLQHAQTPEAAFAAEEVYLATLYNDYQQVRQLSQRETGTLILKPIMGYSLLGVTMHCDYTLTVKIHAGSATLDFDLGREIHYGRWPAKNAIPQIQSQFESIAHGSASALGGELTISGHPAAAVQ